MSDLASGRSPKLFCQGHELGRGTQGNGPNRAGAQGQWGQSCTQTTDVISSLFRKMLPQENLLNFCALGKVLFLS